MYRYKKFIASIAASLLIISYWSCGTENPLAPTRDQNEVWIQANGFDPATINIAVGERVSWVNKDNVTHDVTSGTPNNPANDFRPSPPLGANDSPYTLAFNQTGTFVYYCTIHPSKTGTVIVQ